MDQSSNELSQQLASISERFAGLGERLLGAARHLHSPGTPPQESLLEELAASRREFLSLRDRSRKRAEALHVTLPSDESLETVQGLTALLDLVAEAEIRQAKGEETRRRALAVLDRVLSLSHTGPGEFAPLRECQEKARGLRARIDQKTWVDLPSEAEQLADGDHIFANLLSLIEDRDVLSDDDWSALHDTVGEVFGKSLAAAAARAKLVLPEAASEPSAQTSAPSASAAPLEAAKPSGGGNDRSAGRRNLGKATPSSR